MAIEFFSDPELNNFITVLAIGVIVAAALYIISRHYLHRLVEKTSFIRKGMAKAVPKPVFLLVLLAAVSYALRSLTALNQYDQLITDVFFAVAVLISAYAFAALSNEAITAWLRAHKGFKKPPKIINKIVAATIYIIGISIILIHFNVEITPIIATLGIGGIAIGLALQGTLSNFFAGLNVISDKPIKVGDFIEVDAGAKEPVTGWVEDIGWRTTRIKTMVNTIVIIPNSKVAESVITNYSLPEEPLAVYAECGVDYGSDLDKVEKVTIETVDHFKKTNGHFVKDAEPSFRLREFADSNITFRVYFTITAYEQQFAIKTLFMKELKKRFDREGIEISWPIRKIYTMK